MKNFLFVALMASVFIHGQSKSINIEDLFKNIQRDKTNKSIKDGSYNDLEEKQAFKLFENSNIRKGLNIQIREFNFDLFKMYAKQFKIPLSQMPIFLSTNNLESIEELKKAYSGAENPLLCKECYYLPYRAKFN